MEIRQAVSASGFTVLGAFHPGPGDQTPDDIQTLVLFGNAGPAMWRHFSQVCDTRSELMDSWTRKTARQLAGDIGSIAYFPFDKPPLPFLRWAQAAKAGFVSPLGLNIHPSFGLWHAFRGALGFREVLELPPADNANHPCETCAGKPCLSACPVSAFDGASYAVEHCVDHISAAAGAECMSGGCKARLACPVGRDFIYKPAQMQFHMQAFLKARLAAADTD